MRRSDMWWLIVCALLVSACGQKSGDTPRSRPESARVEHVSGSEVSRVILTARAAERLDIQTDSVREIDSGGSRQTVIPYAAVLYDLNGDTWTYTSPEPLTFVRHEISVDAVKGDIAVLSEGPPPGTLVVTTGVAELFGAEFEFQEE